MAYATRLKKCTGSSEDYRAVLTYFPPFIMFLASGLGGWLGEAAYMGGVPVVFVGFVAFAVVMLLALVCGELLIEAKEAQGGDDKWWAFACVFLGIYCVLMINRATV
jgi:zinc transporter ZupT